MEGKFIILKDLKVALISNFFKEYTTATYFEDSLRKKNIFFQRFSPKNQRNIPKDFNLYFYIDDGSHYVIAPNPKVLKILYIIDTHTGLENDFPMIQFADKVYCAQKNAVEKIAKINPLVEWLPLACSKDYHFSAQGNKIYDLAFIGARGHGQRAQMVDMISINFKNAYVGAAKKEDIGKIYSSARIVFNCSINNDLNMRFFEGLCSGAMLVTDSIHDNGMDSFFNPIYPAFLCYNTPQELLQQIQIYLHPENAEQREVIARRGQQLAFKNTYCHRLEKILNDLPHLKIQNHLFCDYYREKIHLTYSKIIHKLSIARGRH